MLRGSPGGGCFFDRDALLTVHVLVAATATHRGAEGGSRTKLNSMFNSAILGGSSIATTLVSGESPVLFTIYNVHFVVQLHSVLINV